MKTQAPHMPTRDPWWPEIFSITMYGYPTKRDALDIEKHAIDTERPKYNGAPAVQI